MWLQKVLDYIARRKWKKNITQREKRRKDSSYGVYPLRYTGGTGKVVLFESPLKSLHELYSGKKATKKLNQEALEMKISKDPEAFKRLC